MNLILTLYFHLLKYYLILIKLLEKTVVFLLVLETVSSSQNYVCNQSGEAEMVWAKLQIPNSKPLCLRMFTL